MLVSIVRSKNLANAVPFVPEHQRRSIKRYLMLHRGLMVFFFLGYLVILAAHNYEYSLVTDAFVGVIFLLGAVFVFIGIDIQSRLLSEVQSTLQGLLPICATCKKIRIEDGDPEDPKAWKTIESFISKKADVSFSHGYCPECYREVMKSVEEMSRKVS